MTNPLTFHEGHDPEWFDAQYNLRAGRPDYEETVIPRWSAASQAALRNARLHLGRALR